MRKSLSLVAVLLLTASLNAATVRDSEPSFWSRANASVAKLVRTIKKIGAVKGTADAVSPVPAPCTSNCP